MTPEQYLKNITSTNLNFSCRVSKVYKKKGHSHLPVYKTSWCGHYIVECVAEVVERYAAEKRSGNWYMVRY